MMAALRHPSIVMYLGVCLDPPAVVTEYCARGSLNDVLKRARSSPSLAAQLDWPRRLNMVGGVGCACRVLLGFFTVGSVWHSFLWGVAPGNLCSATQAALWWDCKTCRCVCNCCKRTIL